MREHSSEKSPSELFESCHLLIKQSHHFIIQLFLDGTGKFRPIAVIYDLEFLLKNLNVFCINSAASPFQFTIIFTN